MSLDLILNHVSPQHAWFRRCVEGDPSFADFFIEVPESADFSLLARSVHHPPYTVFPTRTGSRRFWTRYGPGQVDLNYRNPDVLLRMAEIAVKYMQRGIGGLRLDAIAFAWKDLATSCSNLPETKSLVAVFRDVVDAVGAGTLLIAETDVVKGHNPYVSAGGGLAHLAYRYESAPIVLHAVLTGSKDRLVAWIRRLRKTGTCHAAFNFISTHDGLYLRPKDPFLDAEAIAALVEAAVAAGGAVRERWVNGRWAPYELNVSIVDLLAVQPGDVFDRLFSALSIILFLPGVPLIYFGTLMALANDCAADGGGRDDPRAINRRRASPSDLPRGDGRHSEFLSDFRKLVSARRNEEAFAPGNAFDIVAGPAEVLVIERVGRHGSVRCYLSLGGDMRVSVPDGSVDFLSGRSLNSCIDLLPYSPVFVKLKSNARLDSGE